MEYTIVRTGVVRAFENLDIRKEVMKSCRPVKGQARSINKIIEGSEEYEKILGGFNVFTGDFEHGCWYYTCFLS